MPWNFSVFDQEFLKIRSQSLWIRKSVPVQDLKISPGRVLNLMKFVNPQAPVAQKIANEVVFRRFQGEGVEFF